MTIAVPDPTVHSAYKIGRVGALPRRRDDPRRAGLRAHRRLPPCPLCLEERYAYYAGVPVLFAALVLLSAANAAPRPLLFVLVALAFLANAALGAYHAGAEWRFWPGPASCTGAQAISRNPRAAFSTPWQTPASFAAMKPPGAFSACRSPAGTPSCRF